MWLCCSDTRGSGQGVLGRLSPAQVRLSPPRGQSQAQPRCVWGWLRPGWLRWSRAAVQEGARSMLGWTWSWPGAARDGPGNCWGSVSCAAGPGEGFLLGFVLLSRGLGLFSPWSCLSWERGALSSPLLLCVQTTQKLLCCPKKGLPALLSSPLTLTLQLCLLL